MDYSKEELIEAKRQVESTLYKLKETIKTFGSKENMVNNKLQITLAKRRLNAFEISNYCIETAIKYN